MTASQISHGRENDVWIEMDGTKGVAGMAPGRAEQDVRPDQRQPQRIYTRSGGPYLSEIAAASARIPSGHPEGVLEAFANIYTAAFDDMIRRASGQKFDAADDPLSQHRRRRRWHELHHTGRRQLQKMADNGCR